MPMTASPFRSAAASAFIENEGMTTHWIGLLLPVTTWISFQHRGLHAGNENDLPPFEPPGIFHPSHDVPGPFEGKRMPVAFERLGQQLAWRRVGEKILGQRGQSLTLTHHDKQHGSKLIGNFLVVIKRISPLR